MELANFTGNVIVQGITGTHGAFHTRQMIQAGTKIIGGTSPTKAGSTLDGIPVYATVEDITRQEAVAISLVFVPAPYAKAALYEAIEASIPLIICITEGIPVHDMIEAKAYASAHGSRIIGPNCPGISIPGVTKLGIIPTTFTMPGRVAIVSRSGTLTYEVAASLTAAGIGQRYIIGIGGDRVRGTDFVDCLKLFEGDAEVDRIILIGEIGGRTEQLAADYIKEHVSKPVFAYIAGHTAPRGVQLGHAGAILGDTQESAAEKTRSLAAAGARTANSIHELVELVKGV